jgi:hypothetical protein
MIIKFDNIDAYVHFEHEREEEAWRQIVRNARVLAPGAEYTCKYKKKQWDGKVSIIGLKRFPTGLLGYVRFLLWSKVKLLPELHDERPPMYIDLDADRITVPLRDYQVDALNSGVTRKDNDVWNPRGIFSIATGGGKTQLAVAMYQYLGIPSVFFVHNRHLVNQARERFQEYGVNAGMLGDGVHDIRPNGITICTIQTIQSFIRKERTEELGFLRDINQAFFDEAHLIGATLDKGNQFYEITRLLPNAFCRWGLTATPFLRDSFSNDILKGATGDVLYTIRSSELIARGYLSAPKIYVQTMPAVEGVPKKWPDCYDTGVVLNQYRNQKVIEWLNKLPDPTMIFTNQAPQS